ncbi:MAG: hypothetical protein IJB05_00485 [Bacteroidales bacterium]|nr:hypothetical protein [Bacteroidales bacterium]
MKRIIHMTLIFGIVLPMLASCKAISEFFDKEEVVAEVGQAKLRKSELDRVVPAGLPAEDSVRLARQYINTWALDQVFLNVAEQQLSKSEKDVTRELEAYRTSLLKYRYEQLYVNERLDTAVSDDAVQEYYEAHSSKFILQRPVVKARFLSISEDSPMLKTIRKKMSSDEVEDIIEADSLAFSSAFKFTTWNNEWIDAAVMAREFGQDYASVLSGVSKGWNERTDTSGVVNAAYVTEIVPKGAMSPLEYSTPFIKDMIISARKQALVSALEHDLLEDARVNGKFVITE